MQLAVSTNNDETSIRHIQSVKQPQTTVKPSRACPNGLLQTWLQYNTNLETPVDFTLWSMISGIASIMGRNVWFGDDGDEDGADCFVTYPNMYIVLVGPSGVQKTTAGQGIYKKILPKYFAGITNITTGETSMPAVYQMMADTCAETGQSPLVIWAPEFKTFIDSASCGNVNQLIGRLTDLYDCPTQHPYKTVARGTQLLDNVCVNLFACSIPEWLPTTGAKDLINSGFSARVLYIYCEKNGKRVARPKRPPGHKQMLEAIVSDLTAISKLRGSFKFIDKATEKFEEDYYKSLPDAELLDEKMESYRSRKQAHYTKLAMVLSAVESDNMLITQRQLKMAIKMIDAVEPGMARAYERVGYHAFESYEMEVLKQLGRYKTMTRADLLGKIGKIIPWDKIQLTLNHMVDKGLIKSFVSYGTDKYTILDSIPTHHNITQKEEIPNDTDSQQSVRSN